MPASSAKSPVNILSDFNKGSLYPKPMSAFTRMVYAIVSDNNTPEEAMKSIERIMRVFIDWNECRVARWVEIARAMDPLSGSDKLAMRLKDMLNRLFDRKGVLSLDFCADMKVTEARKILNELDLKLSKQDVNTILYYYHPSMMVPVTSEGLEVAKKYKLIAKSAEKSQLQKVFAKLEHQQAVELLHYLELEAIVGETNNPSVEKKTAKKKTRRIAKKTARK